MCDKIMEKINIHELVREGIRTAPALYKPIPEDTEITDEHVLMALRMGAAVASKVNGENEILQEKNEDLKCEIAALKQDMEEVQHENSNMRALIQTSLSIHNHAALQDEVEELKKACAGKSAADIIELARRNNILVLNAYEKKHGFDDCDDETWCLFIEYMKGIACAGHIDDTMREWYEEFKINNNE